MGRLIKQLVPGAPIRASELNSILGECITDIRVAPPLFAAKDGNSVTIRMGGGTSPVGGNTITPVYLTQSGGADGTATTKNTYTYNAYLDAAKTQQVGAAALAVKMQRDFGPVVPAAIGILAYEGATPVLWWCDEVYESATCTPATP